MIKKSREGFTLIDSLIGLTIISLFSVFYIGMTRQMNQQIDRSQQTLITERHRYENQLRSK